MDSREESLDAVKDEDEFLDFEFDDLEEAPQKATDDFSSEEEDGIIELVDIVEDDDIIGDPDSDEIAQLLEEETTEETSEFASGEREALQAETGESELELDIFENIEGTEVTLGEEGASDAEEEGTFADEASQSLEIDLDAALKNLEEEGDLEEGASKAEDLTVESGLEESFGALETEDGLEIAMQEEALTEEPGAETFSPPETEEFEDSEPPEAEALEFKEAGEPAMGEAFTLDLDEVIETPGGVEEEEAAGELAGEGEDFEFETEEESPQENPPQTERPPEINEEKIEMMIARVVEEVVERVARETMTAVAERVLGEAIEALKQSLDSPSE